MNEITFPKSEHRYIRQRLLQGKPVGSVRVFNELGKYKPGVTYLTPFGIPVKVDVKRVKDILEYENYRRMGQRQREQLLGAKLIDLLTIRKQAGNIEAYITGPSGAGKSTLAKMQFGDRNIVSTDDHILRWDTPTQPIIDWASIRSIIEKRKKPTVLEGLVVDPELFAKAQQRIVVDPGLRETVKRRVGRGIRDDVNKRRAKEMYKEIWMKQTRPDIESSSLPFKIVKEHVDVDPELKKSLNRYILESIKRGRKHDKSLEEMLDVHE